MKWHKIISGIWLGCRQVLPPELEREIVVLDCQLPDKEQLGVVLDGICESAKLKKLKDDERDLVLDTGLRKLAGASGQEMAERLHTK